MSTELNTLTARVDFLDAKVAEVRRILAEAIPLEQAFERQHGERPGAPRAWQILLGYNPTITGPLYRTVYWAQQQIGAWPDFDRALAQRIGPRVRDLKSKCEQYMLPIRIPAAEGVQEAELVTRGNALMREAYSLMWRWLGTPPARFDTWNQSWGTAWYRRNAIESSMLVALVGELTNRTVSQTARDHMSQIGAPTSPDPATLTRTNTIEDGLKPPRTDGGGGGGTGNRGAGADDWFWLIWPGIALVAGGAAYFVWRRSH